MTPQTPQADNKIYQLSNVTTTIMVAKKPALPANAIQVLAFVADKGPLRFSEIERSLELSPTSLDRALKALVAEILVTATMIEGSGRKGSLSYETTRRGQALLRSAKAFHRALNREASVLGELTTRLDPFHS